MSNWEELKGKFPEAEYPPDTRCPLCRGEGEKWEGGEGEFLRAAWVPCICLFIGFEDAEETCQMLSDTCTKILKELAPEVETDGLVP